MPALARRWWLIVLLLVVALLPLLWWAFASLNRSPAEQPTVSAIAIETAVPSTPIPTPTPTSLPPTTTPAPPTAAPTLLPTTVPAPLPTTCPEQPAPRWANTLYAEFGQQLGCAVTGEISVSASEIPANGAFQYYERGTMVWRQHADIIYVLYDDGSYAAYPDDSPDNYYDTNFLKGGFGYLWNTNEDVRGLISNPLTIEYAAADFALQDFESGTIFYFNDSGGQNYVLLADPATWVLR